MNISTKPIEKPTEGKIIIHLYRGAASRVVNISTLGSLYCFAERFATPLGVSVEEVTSIHNISNNYAPAKETIEGTSLEFMTDFDSLNSTDTARLAAQTVFSGLEVIAKAMQKEDAEKELDYPAIWSELDALNSQPQDSL